MGYEQAEPVALCDGCGKRMFDGSEWWTMSSTGVHITVRACTYSLLAEDVHYCCVRPCLERAVIREVRKLDEHKTQKDKGEQVEALQG